MEVDPATSGGGVPPSKKNQAAADADLKKLNLDTKEVREKGWSVETRIDRWEKAFSSWTEKHPKEWSMLKIGVPALAIAGLLSAVAASGIDLGEVYRDLTHLFAFPALAAVIIELAVTMPS